MMMRLIGEFYLFETWNDCEGLKLLTYYVSIQVSGGVPGKQPHSLWVWV